MASLFLGVVGNAIAPGIGGLVGGLIGAAFDSLVLIPAITPEQTAKGPRVESLKLQKATEGDPMWVVIGPRNRVPGEVIWQTDLKEVDTTTEQGGKGGGGTKVDTATYFVSFAICFADTKDIPIHKIRKIIAAGGKVIYDGVPSSPRYKSVSIYYGNQVAPDPVMEAIEGVGKVPLYKKSCLVVFEDFAVGDFGNAVPNPCNAIIEQDPDVSLGEAIGRLLERAGLTSGDYEVTRLPFCLHGYTLPDPMKTTDSLAPLMIGFGAAVQESGGKLIFFPQGGETEFTVPVTDMAATETGDDEDAPHPVRFTDADNITVPGRVNVKFIDNANQCQPGAIAAVRADGPNTNDAIMTANINVTMNSDEADAAGQRMLWSYEAERQPVEFSLPPSYIYLQEGDAVFVTDKYGTTHRITIGTIDRGANFLLQIGGRTSCAATYQQEGDGTGSGGGGGEPYSPPETTGYVIDMPALIEDHCTKIGVYFMATVTDPGDLWNGAALYSSPDDVTYLPHGNVAAEATLGTVTIGVGTGPTDEWDEANVLEADLLSGSFSTVTRDQCLAGANRFAIQTRTGEWEIMGGATVTQVDVTRIQIRNLLRGLRGTGHLVGQHLAAGAPIVVLSGSDGSINFWNRGSSGLNTSDYYKLPAVGGVVSEYPKQQVEIVGRTMRPMSVANLRGQRGSDIRLYGDDIGTSASLAAFTSTTVNRFKGIEVGQPVVTDGFVNTDNNGYFMVIAKPDNQTLVVDDTLVNEAAGPWVSLERGGPDDTTITWTRRSKTFASPFATPEPPPLWPDEVPERYELEFRRGGPLANPIRTVTCNTPSFVYNAAIRAADGLVAGSDIHVTVYQMSNVVGRSVGTARRING